MKTHTVTIPTAPCSWCQETNLLGGGPITCASCGHRADVPRLLCDCRGCCAMRSEKVALKQTEQDREQLTAYILQAVKAEARRSGSGSHRLAVRAALALGMTYEDWRKEYVLNLSQQLQQWFHRMDAVGVDVERLLRGIYDATLKQAVN